VKTTSSSPKTLKTVGIKALVNYSFFDVGEACETGFADKWRYWVMRTCPGFYRKNNVTANKPKGTLQPRITGLFWLGFRSEFLFCFWSKLA